MISKMRSRVSADTLLVLGSFRSNDTVLGETPASSAISFWRNFFILSSYLFLRFTHRAGMMNMLNVVKTSIYSSLSKFELTKISRCLVCFLLITNLYEVVVCQDFEIVNKLT